MNILIIQQRNWAVNFGTFLADNLKKRGHNIGSISLKKSTHHHLLKNGYTIIYDIDDNIIDNSSLFKSLSKMKMKIIFDDGYKIFTIDKIIE